MFFPDKSNFPSATGFRPPPVVGMKIRLNCVGVVLYKTVDR